MTSLLLTITIFVLATFAVSPKVSQFSDDYLILFARAGQDVKQFESAVLNVLCIFKHSLPPLILTHELPADDAL